MTIGPSGITTDTGDRVWEPEVSPGDSNIARDGLGGFAWNDLEGLWWLPADAPAPTLTVEEPGVHFYGVTPTEEGPVAHLIGRPPRYLNLATGEEVPAPEAPRVLVDNHTYSRAAAGGLVATVTEPEVVYDPEGQPKEITAPARLVVSRGGATIVDMPVGGAYSPWVGLHDFDGRRVILSRGPFEPALPEETFFVIDLACGSCLRSFGAGASRAALVGVDSEWDDGDPDLQPGVLVGAWLKSDAGVKDLADGVYLGFLDPQQTTADRVTFDLAVWFSAPDADRAAYEDGETDLPVPNDYYLRNAEDRWFTMPVAAGVEATSVWYDYETDPDLESDPVDYADLLAALQSDQPGPHTALRHDPWWLTIVDGRLVRLDEQYLP